MNTKTRLNRKRERERERERERSRRNYLWHYAWQVRSSNQSLLSNIDELIFNSMIISYAESY